MEMEQLINQVVLQYFQNKGVQERFLDYLNRHDVVGREIFSYLGKDYSNIGDSLLFPPIPKKVFLRRIPFYFYKPDISADRVGCLSQYINSFYINNRNEESYRDKIEVFYKTLEKLLYDYKISVSEIFEYPIIQSGRIEQADLLLQWVHYLELAQKYDIEDLMPQHFFISYNSLLEKEKLPPVIFDLKEMFIGEYVGRTKNIFRMEGTFPCDEKGRPIMRWIGVDVRNATRIWAEVNEKHKGYLFVEANPKTLIRGRNCWGPNDDGSDAWYELYVGPQLMEFDFEALKDIRKREGLTQQQIADWIGASLRTYQKWESGDTNPDCYYLLRLMNVLDIRQVSELTKIVDVD
ncbi:MAG: helix-turn-helix domain-containing protein [Dehalobacter sp.]|nr:helix-turn-helix domain-containing protein [Dehalobacter sp.]